MEHIMRKTLVAVATVAALAAGGISNAQAHDDAGPFIAGAVIGTVIGAVLGPPPVAVVAPPVVYPPAPRVVYAPPPPRVVYTPAPRVIYVPHPVVKRGPPAHAYYPQRGYAQRGWHGQSHHDWH
jgi:hypothetical protein